MSKGSHLPHFVSEPKTSGDFTVNELFINKVGGKTVKEHNKRVDKLWTLAKMGFKFAFDRTSKDKAYFVDKPDDMMFPSQFWFQLDGYESYYCYKTVYNAIRSAENLVKSVHNHAYRYRDDVVEWAEQYRGMY